MLKYLKLEGIICLNPMIKLIIFFLHIFQLFLDDTKVKNFITCFKGTCTSQFVSIKLVHVADVTYPWLTTSEEEVRSCKQYQDPCFGSPMDSMNYQQCFLNFPLQPDYSGGSRGGTRTPLIFEPNSGLKGRKIFLGDCSPPPPPPLPLI